MCVGVENELLVDLHACCAGAHHQSVCINNAGTLAFERLHAYRDERSFIVVLPLLRRARCPKHLAPRPCQRDANCHACSSLSQFGGWCSIYGWSSGRESDPHTDKLQRQRLYRERRLRKRDSTRPREIHGDE